MIVRYVGRLLRLLLAGLVVFTIAVASGRAYDYELARTPSVLQVTPKFGVQASGRVPVTALAGGTARPATVQAARWPTREAMRWQPPRGFLRAAFCIHRHESVDWYRAYVDWRGRPSPYSGGLQFLLSTWRRAGGSGHPHQWRPREQVYRAFVIWRRNGGSWREWGTAWKCGLR